MSKVAFISGAGEGIGAAIAQKLAHDDYAVAVNDLKSEKAEQVARKITDSGGKALALGGDMSDVERVRAMIAATTEKFGSLNAIIANAGITSYGDFFDYQPEDFDRVLAVNLRGSYFSVQAAARQMRAQGQGGRIVLTSSVTGHQAIKYLSAYGMTKAALEMLAKNLVAELSPHKITINAVAPGATVTPRNLRDDPGYVAHWAGVVPLGMPAMPEDIANVVRFLCSESAAHITGQTIVVDGGWTAISPTPALDFVNKSED